MWLSLYGCEAVRQKRPKNTQQKYFLPSQGWDEILMITLVSS